MTFNEILEDFLNENKQFLIDHKEILENDYNLEYLDEINLEIVKSILLLNNIKKKNTYLKKK